MRTLMLCRMGLACWMLCVTTGVAWAEEARVVRDVQYAQAGDTKLLLDLHQPARSEEALSPIIVWVHGGAWRSGSKADMPLAGLVAKGYAVASVDYRLSPVAPFPAQIHDIKAALRFLHAERKKHRLDTGRLAVAGSSAGGHLAALVGVTNGHAELEGSREPTEATPRVRAIVDLFGPTNLTTILAQSTPHGLKVRVPALELLLGGQPDQKVELARLASPVFHVDADDPPLLLIHGDQDPQVPINQAHELHAAYRKLKLPVTLEVIPGAAHGGKQFHDAERTELMREFLERAMPAQGRD